MQRILYIYMQMPSKQRLTKKIASQVCLVKNHIPNGFGEKIMHAYLDIAGSKVMSK